MVDLFNVHDVYKNAFCGVIDFKVIVEIKISEDKGKGKISN